LKNCGVLPIRIHNTINGHSETWHIFGDFSNSDNGHLEYGRIGCLENSYFGGWLFGGWFLGEWSLREWSFREWSFRDWLFKERLVYLIFNFTL
jgi:hypothetical protein